MRLALILLISSFTLWAEQPANSYTVTARGIYFPKITEGKAIDSSFWIAETKYVDLFSHKIEGYYKVLYHHSGLPLHYSDSSLNAYMKQATRYAGTVKPILHGKGIPKYQKKRYYQDQNSPDYQVEEYKFGKLVELKESDNKLYFETREKYSEEWERLKAAKLHRTVDTLIFIDSSNAIFTEVSVRRMKKDLLRMKGGTLQLKFRGKCISATKISENSTLFTTNNGSNITKELSFQEWQEYSNRKKWKLYKHIDKECNNWRSPYEAFGWPDVLPTSTNLGPTAIEISGFYGWIKRTNDYLLLGPSASIEGGDGFFGKGIGVALFTEQPGGLFGALHLRYSTQHIGHNYTDILEETYRGPELVFDTWIVRFRAAKLYTAGRENSFNRFSLGLSLASFLFRMSERIDDLKPW